MNTKQTFFVFGRFVLSLILPVVLLACSGRLAAVELRFGNSIEFVHPDEVETVQYCRKAGIGYNLNNQTSNPGGGGIVNTKEGRLIVLYFNDHNALTLEQLQPLSKASHLSSLTCPWWVDDEILGFFTHPGRFPRVTGLSIDGSKITDEGLAGLKNLPIVASLNLESKSITDKGVLHLSKVPTFSLLRLNAARITDKGVSYLTDLPNLSFLELRTTQTTDAGLEYLGRLPRLHTLYLDDTSIAGSGLKHLAPLARLRLLSLTNTSFNDQGLAELAEHPNLAKVEVLYLSNTEITDAGCEAFERLNNLTVLTLDGTEVTDKGIRHLKDMPRLYNLMLGSRVTREGRNWLGANARFAPSLQRQFREAAYADKNTTKKEMDLRSFQAGLRGVDATVFQLGQASRDPKAVEARRQLVKMEADAIGPIVDMAEKCNERGHPLRNESTFRRHFRNNATAVLGAVCTKAMPALAGHYAECNGGRELISRVLGDVEDGIVPHLEAWLQHESPAVRLEALHQLARRAAIRRLGPGAASPATKQHNSLKLSGRGRERVYSLLADSDAKVQQAACTVVLAVEDDHSVKAEALAEATLRETDVFTLNRMQEALYLLAEQQPVDGKDLPVLIDGFTVVLRKSDNKTAQHMAILRLGTLGGKAQEAIGLLQAYQEGPDEQLAAAAGHALDRIHRCPITLMRVAGIPVDVQTLVFTLTTHDREAIGQASEELVRRGPSMVRPLSIAARGETDEYYPKKAAGVVAQWKQEDVLPMLRPAFNWTGTSARLFVIHSISQMKWSELPDVVEDSLESVDAKVSGRMRSLFSTLAGNTTGRASQELARLIAAEFRNPALDWHYARSLIESLTLCYPSSGEVPSLLVDILRQDAQYSSRFACDALGDIAHDHPAGKTDDRKMIIGAILGMLQTTKNEDLKRECIETLARFGVEAREALPTLRQIQKEGPKDLVTSATRAITGIDRPTEPAARKPGRPASEDPFGGRE